MLMLFMKTVKCLMIVPNPESSLNEDASRLMLENYEDYCKHAKLFTSIHAQKSEKTEKTGMKLKKILLFYSRKLNFFCLFINIFTIILLIII